jgi:hypothetical protein
MTPFYLSSSIELNAPDFRCEAGIAQFLIHMLGAGKATPCTHKINLCGTA